MTRSAKFLHDYAHACAHEGECPFERALEQVKRIPLFGRLLYAYFKRAVERESRKWEIAQDFAVNDFIRTPRAWEEESRRLGR